MKIGNIFFSPLALAALYSAPSWAAEGVNSKATLISKATLSENYCHLKFPAIQEETLYWDRPVLKDPTDSDIIDFYGPCNHDPLGKSEIERQRRAYVHIRRHDTGGSD